MVMKSLKEVQDTIQVGDVINDVDTVTSKSLTLIYTKDRTYATVGGTRPPYNYKRVKKVTRDGKDIYISEHGGSRAGSFGKKINTNGSMLGHELGWDRGRR